MQQTNSFDDQLYRIDNQEKTNKLLELIIDELEEKIYSINWGSYKFEYEKMVKLSNIVEDVTGYNKNTNENVDIIKTLKRLFYSLIFENDHQKFEKDLIKSEKYQNIQKLRKLKNTDDNVNWLIPNLLSEDLFWLIETNVKSIDWSSVKTEDSSNDQKKIVLYRIHLLCELIGNIIQQQKESPEVTEITKYAFDKLFNTIVPEAIVEIDETKNKDVCYLTDITPILTELFETIVKQGKIGQDEKEYFLADLSYRRLNEKNIKLEAKIIDTYTNTKLDETAIDYLESGTNLLYAFWSKFDESRDKLLSFIQNYTRDFSEDFIENYDYVANGKLSFDRKYITDFARKLVYSVLYKMGSKYAHNLKLLDELTDEMYYPISQKIARKYNF
jgi:polyhydroxyalkanoate synthesis regulator phasin